MIQEERHEYVDPFAIGFIREPQSSRNDDDNKDAELQVFYWLESAEYFKN